MHREDQFIPELIVRNGPAALDFYKSVFDAKEVHRMMKLGSEKLMHGELTLDGHKFFVCDEFPASEGGTCKSPETLGGTGVRVTLLVDDADGVVARAVAAGARVSMPVQDMFWGGRYGKIVDPFGHEGGQPADQRAESRGDSGRGRRILREAKITRMSLS
jgi:PhnB protein